MSQPAVTQIHSPAPPVRHLQLNDHGFNTRAGAERRMNTLPSYTGHPRDVEAVVIEQSGKFHVLLLCRRAGMQYGIDCARAFNLSMWG